MYSTKLTKNCHISFEYTDNIQYRWLWMNWISNVKLVPEPSTQLNHIISAVRGRSGGQRHFPNIFAPEGDPTSQGVLHHCGRWEHNKKLSIKILTKSVQYFCSATVSGGSPMCGNWSTWRWAAISLQCNLATPHIPTSLMQTWPGQPGWSTSPASAIWPPSSTPLSTSSSTQPSRGAESSGPALLMRISCPWLQLLDKHNDQQSTNQTERKILN